MLYKTPTGSIYYLYYIIYIIILTEGEAVKYNLLIGLSGETQKTPLPRVITLGWGVSCL